MEDVTIVGAGPAGLATALQLRRLGLSPLVLERSEVGGLLRSANLVENYPGFLAGIRGPELAALFAEQARRSTVRVELEEVTRLGRRNGAFRVVTRARERDSKIVVVASGTKPRLLSDATVPSELGSLVVYEVQPLLTVRDKHIVIVGAGDAAFDYALNLGRKNDVTVLDRGGRPTCLPLLEERAGACTRISYCRDTTVARFVSVGNGEMLLECDTPAGTSVLRADHVLVAIGREPRLEFVAPELLADARELENDGVLHFAGDVKNGRFRQTAIAVGDGLLAAMKISSALEGRFA